MPPLGKSGPLPPSPPLLDAPPVAPKQPKVVPAPPALVGQNPIPTKTAPPAGAPVDIRARTIQRRQTLLKGLGIYQGQIDGVWGAKSQRAWAAYIDRRRKGRPLAGPILTAPFTKTKAAAALKATVTANARAQAAAAKKAAAGSLAASRAAAGKVTPLSIRTGANQDTIVQNRIAAAAAGRQAATAVKNLQVYKALKTGWLGAAKYNIDALGQALGEPTNTDSNQAKVAVTQKWLIAHGETQVKVSGKWDVTTHDAITRQYTIARQQQHATLVKNVTHLFYSTTIPGTTPSWWTEPGPVPSPAELTKTLMAGGFKADNLISLILKNSTVPQTVYMDWRNTEIAKLMSKYHSVFDSPNFVALSGNLTADVSTVLMRSARVLGPKGFAEFAGQVDVLSSSRSGDEFARRIAGAIAAADLKYQLAQRDYARHHISWFPEVVNAALDPWKGHMPTALKVIDSSINPLVWLDYAEKGLWFVKTAAIADYYISQDFITSDKDRPFNISDPEYWATAKGSINHAPPVIDFVNHFLADPFLLARPLRLASTTLKWGASAFIDAEKLGFLGSYEAKLGVKFATKATAPGFSTTLADDAFTLSRQKAVYLNSTFHLPITTAFGNTIRRIPGVERQLELKEAAVERVNAKIMQASRNGFMPRRWRSSEGVELRYDPEPWAMVGESKQTSRLGELDKQAGALATDMHYVAAGMFHDLFDQRASLYVKFGDNVLSGPGRQALGAFASEYEAEAVHGMANKYAWDMYERSTQGYTEEEYQLLAKKYKMFDEEGNQIQTDQLSVDSFYRGLAKLTKKFTKNPEQGITDTHSAAQRSWVEYQRVLEAAGSYGEGSGDPEIMAKIGAIVRSGIEEFEHGHLPILQRELEAAYMKIGHDLYDTETGVWVDVDKETAADVQAWEGFQEERAIVRDNPLYGKPITYTQMMAHIAGEQRRRNAGLARWIAAQKAAGKTFEPEVEQGLFYREGEKIRKSYIESNGKRQIGINHQAVSRLLAEMGLPEDLPVEVRWMPGTKSTASYYGKKVYLNVSLDWLSPDEQRLFKMDKLARENDVLEGGSTAEESLAPHHAKIAELESRMESAKATRENGKANVRRLWELRAQEGRPEAEVQAGLSAGLENSEKIFEKKTAGLEDAIASAKRDLEDAHAAHSELTTTDEKVGLLYHRSLAHEIMHRFQQENMGEEEWANRQSLEYWDRPVEKQAKAFSHSEYVINFDDLVSVIKEPPGMYYDARRTLSLPDFHAKHLDDAYWDRTGQKRPPWLHSGVTGLAGAAAPPLTIYGNSRAAQEIAEMAHALSPFKSNDINELLEHAEPGKNTPKLYGAKRHLANKPKTKKERAARRDALNSFRENSRKYTIQHKATMDAVLPYAMRDSKIFMVALSQFESWPMRNMYKVAQGGLNAWIFLALPMRLGWVVRNVIDNHLKTFIAGANNPKAYFGVWQGGSASQALGEGAHRLSSIFEGHIGPALEAARFIDKLFGTDVAIHFQSILDTFWTHKLETVSQILKSHGLNIPDEWLEQTLFDPFDTYNNSLPFSGKNPYELSEVNKMGDNYIKLYQKHFGDRTTAVAKADKVTGEVKLIDTGKNKESDFARFRATVWHVMANTPENYYKKVNYNDEMTKLVKGGMTPMEAFPIAWKRIEDTLFDYSKVTVLEDNLRMFFPFIQFWRKNTVLWTKNFAENPWLTVTMNNYLNWRDELHKDEPQWMRRYFSVKEITDATASVPGLGWMVRQVLPNDSQFDPISFLSFAPYYRAFKSDNPTLPSDQQGWKFLGGFLDGLNQWGLGLNPFIRKPLESAHIASQESWQQVFPQTSVAAALTSEFFGKTAAGYVMDWEYIFSWGIGRTPADQYAQNFEFYVRRFEENQIAKGLPADRGEAEAHVKMQFLSQNLWGYFGGIYFRHNTPEDYHVEKIQDAILTGSKSYADLSQKDRTLLAIWNKGGIDKKTGRLKMTRNDWNRYIETIPMIEAFYSHDHTFAEGTKMIQEHPELRQYVDPLYTSGKYYTVNSSAAAAWYLRSAEFFDVNKMLTEADVPYDVIKAASSLLVTPELQAHWAKNDTPADERNKMITGLIHQQMHDMETAYFAIPETDFAARAEYLKMHPDMERGWNANLSNPDDFKMIDNHFKANLRDTYFATVKEHGFDAAHDLLVQFPFMFEGTKSESHIDEARGLWVPGGKGSKQGNAYLAGYDGMQTFFRLIKTNKNAAYDFLASGTPDARAAQFYFDHYGKKHNTARSVAFRAARSALKFYFNLRDNSGPGGKAAANAWLQSDKPDAIIAKDYFDKWSKSGSYHAHDFLRAEKWLKLYWALPHDKREAYLKSNSPGARILRRYFAKWADDKKGLTAQAQAYIHAKPALDHYFSLPKAEREKFLHSGSKEAAIVLDYFKRFSSTAKLEKAFWKLHPNLKTTDPELRNRMAFWKNYWMLSPADRPAYILSDAANHGVFVYGALGDGDAHNREQKFIRAATASKMTIDGKQKHLTVRQATFLYVKPLLNMLATITDNKVKSLFIEANPELQQYLAAYSHPLTTGNAKLDYALGAYFSAEPGSAKRFDVLAQNPELQKYFDKHSSPAQRAMHSMLTVFFSLKGQEQAQYKLEHPEIQDFFDQSRLQKAADALVFTNLELADPRLHDAFATATADEEVSARHMREKLQQAHINQFTPDSIVRRRERTPETKSQVAKGQGTKKAYKSP